ncbi:hypothetical protein KJA15_01680 [Patescibacteria group bacterium]|nr:hypothetical protein [Patescibacteria group bacterium]
MKWSDGLVYRLAYIGIPVALLGIVAVTAWWWIGDVKWTLVIILAMTGCILGSCFEEEHLGQILIITGALLTIH